MDREYTEPEPVETTEAGTADENAANPATDSTDEQGEGWGADNAPKTSADDDGADQL